MEKIKIEFDQGLIREYISLKHKIAKTTWYSKEYDKYRKKLAKIKKLLGFIPILKNRDISKPYLTKSEAKLLNQLKRGYYAEKDKPSELAIVFQYIFKCRKCGYIIISRKFLHGLDLMLDHYIQKHNDNLEHRNILVSIRKLPITITSFSSFWLIVRIQNKYIKGLTLAEFENRLLAKRNSIYNRTWKLITKEYYWAYSGVNYYLVNRIEQKRLDIKPKLPIFAQLNNMDHIPNLKRLFNLKRIKRKRKRKQKPNIEKLFMKHYLQP